jgi:Domain of unknown function (DUF5667)
MMTVPSVTVSPAERRRAREFARLLEGTRPPVGHELESLVSLATSLRPADIAPRAEFRAALRESLVAEAAARQIAPAGTPKPDPAQAPRHRVRTVVATGVLVSLVGGFGAAAASTHALPGDSLYGLKRGIESAQLRFAHSDLSRGRDLLDQADSRLSEAEALAASEDARSPETQTRIAGAIADLETATRAGADALQASYADTGDVEPLIELDRFVVDQRARLADLSALLNPDLRALLAPLSQLLLTLQPHLDSLVADSSATSGVATGSTSASGQPEGGSISGRPPLIGNAVDVAARINGLTGGDPSTTASGVAVASPGVLGSAGTGSPLPSVVPHVKIPRPAPPTSTLPLPSAAVPSIPVPSAPGLPEPGVPSAPVPGVPLPTPITAPTLPSTNVTPPACIPIPPLPTC